MTEQHDVSAATPCAAGEKDARPPGLTHSRDNAGTGLDASTTALRDRFRALVEATAQIVWTTDGEGRALEAWPSWQVYTGQAEEEVSGYGWFDAIHPDDRQPSTAAWQRAIAERQPLEIVHRIRRYDGVHRWFHVRAVPILTTSGDIREWVGICNDITERRQQEEEREESLRLDQERRMFAQIAENSAEFIGICDTQFRAFYVNQAAMRMVGLDDLEQAKRTEIKDYFFPEDHAFIYDEFFPQVLRDGHAEVEVRFRHFKTGDALWMIYSVIVLKDASGEPLGYATISRNITERKRLQRELEERARDLIVVMETMTDGMVVYGPDGDVRFMNTAYRALIALDEDMLKQSFIDRARAISPRDPATGQSLPEHAWPSVRLLHGEVLTGSNSVDVLVRAHDGREVHINITGAPLLDAAGQPHGAVMVIRDVAGRRQLERRTHEALDALLAMAETLVRVRGDEPEDASPELETYTRLAELIRQLLGCERVALVRYDTTTGLQEMLAVVGIPSEREAHWHATLSGTRLASYVDPLQRARLHAGQSVLLDVTQPSRPETSDGQILSLISPMRIGEQLVGMLALVHESPSHEYSAEDIVLADAAAQLAALVVERERLLRERAAAEAKSLILAEANRRMDEFLSIASHEVRTPLTTIKTNVQVARRHAERVAAGARGTDDDDAQDIEALIRLLSRATAAIDRQNRLVGDLLDVSRIQQGRLHVRLQPLDVVALTRDAVEEQRHAYPGRRITLSLPRRQVPVLADGDRMRQVIANYLINALKYSAATQPVAATLSVEGATVRFTVRDHGPGVPTDEREQVWERFHQVEGTTHQSGSNVGLGLGLYICKEIVERHGGSVGVEDAPSGGALFWFTLPLSS